MSGEGGRFELTRLAAKHRELTKDGRFMSNRASIEVLTERVHELIQRAEENYSPERLITLRSLWEKLLIAEESQNHLEATKIKKLISAEFEAIYHDYMAWQQAANLMDLTSKMVEREAKIAKDLHAILTADDAYKLTSKIFGVIVDTIRQQTEVPDNVKAQILKRLEYEFTRIIGEGSGEEPGRGSGKIIDA